MKQKNRIKWINQFIKTGKCQDPSQVSAMYSTTEDDLSMNENSEASLEHE